ncbi:hypothetical protein [Asanoa siamensis]|uniref:Uncharacterized protein n=1 Tax=Asanoa siamensis TaxID=926357 RepID=A0ABQ4CPV8_9ACTN|nr:hypothetical protein [Asanoa siamensis]GIF73311.1 hypothetical protein Asi02nite_28290 [Asanoa siamensis]
MRLLLAGFGALVAVLVSASPAWAHGGDAPDGTDYRTVVTAVSPAPAGLRVRAVEAGARLELTNRTGTTVEVLGYQNEPYLEVRPDGVYENVHSPAVYLNATLTGTANLPATADPTLPPTWRRTSGEPVALWHDHRSHWMLSTPPPSVTADPSRVQRIRDWVVPLRTGGVTPLEVHGTLDWVPPPSAGVWWAWSLVAALGVAVLGVVGRLRRLAGLLTVRSAASSPGAASAASAASGSRGWVPVALAAVSGVGGVAAVVYAVGREIDAGNDGFGAVLGGLFAGQIWPVLTGLAALAAGAYALLRRPAADFALALAGVCVAVFAGVSNAGAFGNGVVPVPWSPVLGRLLLAVVIAAGAGVAGAAALRMRATAGRPPVPGPRRDPDRPAHDGAAETPAVESGA